MVTLIWTEFAIEDVNAIHDYIALDSEFYARKFTDRIIERAEALRTHPHLGRVVPDFNNELIRELIEGNYRIIYKVEPETVIIVRVHHSARLLLNLE